VHFRASLKAFFLHSLTAFYRHFITAIDSHRLGTRWKFYHGHPSLYACLTLASIHRPKKINAFGTRFFSSVCLVRLIRTYPKTNEPTKIKQEQGKSGIRSARKGAE
jgi:hypothetical protein